MKTGDLVTHVNSYFFGLEPDPYNKLGIIIGCDNPNIYPGEFKILWCGGHVGSAHEYDLEIVGEESHITTYHGGDQ